jgi:ABC-type anion transport system duplicated permease subunit
MSEDEEDGRTNEIKAWERVINKLLGSTVTILSTIATIVGVPGLLVIGLFWAINKWSTSAQKTELIDKYILLKTVDGDYNYAAYVIILLVIVIGIFIIFHRRTIKTYQKEIDRVTKHKEKLESTLTKKTQKNHTKKKKK